VTDPNEPKPFAPPYVLNPSSVTIENGEEIWPMSPPPPRQPGQRRWVLPVVILSVVVLVGGLVTAGAVAVQAIADRADQADNEPAIPAVPAVPDAPPGSDGIPTEPPTAAAVSCPPTCFTPAHAGLMIPDGSLLISLGGNFLLNSTSMQAPTTAAQLYQADASQWASRRPLPDVCFFADSTSPVSPAIGGPDAGSTDAVVLLGSGTDPSGAGTLTQAARFFTDTASADAYLASTAQQVVTCHLANSGVGPAAKLDVPNTVQMVTFTAHIGATTIYSIDLQRDNVVVRMRLATPGAISEADFDRYVRTWATTNLAQLPVQ
jgi:hypothetical protein